MTISQPTLPSLEPSKWVPTDRQPARAPTGISWADFAAWVDWLDDAYELALPVCWAEHEGVVHTLAALWDAWLAVYSLPRKGKDTGPPPAETARAGWHVQFLRPILTDLREERSPLEACRRNESHAGYIPRGRRTRLPDALDHLAASVTDPQDGAGDVLRDESETTRFDALSHTLGSAAVLGVLYNDGSNGA